MTPDQLEQYGYAEFAKLEKAFGPKLPEKLHSAALMIHDLDLKQPGLKNLLRSKGIGDSALIASMLIRTRASTTQGKGAKRRWAGVRSAAVSVGGGISVRDEASAGGVSATLDTYS